MKELSVKDAAALEGVSRTTILNRIRNGDYRARRSGNLWRVLEEDIRAKHVYKRHGWRDRVPKRKTETSQDWEISV